MRRFFELTLASLAALAPAPLLAQVRCPPERAVFGPSSPPGQPAVELTLVGACDIGATPAPPPHIRIRVMSQPPRDYQFRCRQGEGGARNSVALEVPADLPAAARPRVEAAIARAFRSVTIEYIHATERPRGNSAPDIVFLPYLFQSMGEVAAALEGEASVSQRFVPLPETYRFHTCRRA